MALLLTCYFRDEYAKTMDDGGNSFFFFDHVNFSSVQKLAKNKITGKLPKKI